MAKRKRRNFTPEFKAEVVLEKSGESSQENVDDITSAKQLSKSWKQQLLEMPQPSLTSPATDSATDCL